MNYFTYTHCKLTHCWDNCVSMVYREPACGQTLYMIRQCYTVLLLNAMIKSDGFHRVQSSTMFEYELHHISNVKLLSAVESFKEIINQSCLSHDSFSIPSHTVRYTSPTKSIQLDLSSVILNKSYPSYYIHDPQNI